MESIAAKKEYGVEILTVDAPVSASFQVGKKAMMIYASGFRVGERVLLGQILNSSNPMCKAGEIFTPSPCGCPMQLFKTSGDADSENSRTIENNMMLIDVPGTYYLMYMGDSEEGVSTYKKTIDIPADAQSARQSCCSC